MNPSKADIEVMSATWLVLALQAADIVRLVGIGRNEYIATMNKCKAKKLLWRVNRSIVKEHLPTEQLETEKQDWWIAHVVNIGEALLCSHRLSRHCVWCFGLSEPLQKLSCACHSQSESPMFLA